MYKRINDGKDDVRVCAMWQGDNVDLEVKTSELVGKICNFLDVP